MRMDQEVVAYQAIRVVAIITMTRKEWLPRTARLIARHLQNMYVLAITDRVNVRHLQNMHVLAITTRVDVKAIRHCDINSQY
jgi:hypothetical protein